MGFNYFWARHVLQLPSRRFLSETSRFHLTSINCQSVRRWRSRFLDPKGMCKKYTE